MAFFLVLISTKRSEIIFAASRSIHITQHELLGPLFALRYQKYKGQFSRARKVKVSYVKISS